MPKKKGSGEDAIAVGFDLGATKMFAVVFDARGKVLGSDRRATGGHEGAEAGLKRLSQCVRAALDEAGVGADAVSAVGMGCPGVVDMEDGVLHSTPNLGWPDVPLVKVVSKEFGCPVFLLNDVDAGTYGEYVAGAGKGARSLLGVFPGTGVGGGFIYDGRLVRGKRYSAMEIGRMRWPSLGMNTEAGEWPIFETFCSRLSIASACAAETFRGNAPTLMKKAGTELAKFKSKTVAGAYEAGDPGVRRVVDRAVEHLAAGIGAAVCLVAPDRIVLGGGLVEAMPEVFLKGVRKGLGRSAPAELLEGVDVLAAKLGDFASVTGAAAYALEALPKG